MVMLSFANLPPAVHSDDSELNLSKKLTLAMIKERISIMLLAQVL